MSPARAIWKGVIRLGEGVPVKLYSAVEDRTVRFRLLHAEDRVPLRRRLVHPVSGDEVEYAEALRGVETDEGTVVVMEPEELDALEPPDSRDIEVLRFVHPEVLPHLWYDRPYYLGPDGPADPWQGLAAALERTGLEGVVRWTMRKRRYLGSLRLHGGRPMLITLRRADELIALGEVPRPEGRELSEEELDMARRLMEMMKGDFEPDSWEDTYQARLRELIAARAEGKAVSLGEARARKRSTEDLREALAASLDREEGRKRA